MKKTFLLLAIASTLDAPAADLLVAIGGGGSVHPSITSALAAAVDGDRILVAPGTYNENITIIRSVEIASNSQTLRYSVNGNLSFSPASPGARTATVVSMVLSGNITDNGASAPAGSILRLIDCKVNHVYTTSNTIRYVLFSDSVMNSASLCKADVVDCYLRSNAGSIPALNFFGTTAVNTINHVVGNELVTQPGSLLPLLQSSPFQPLRAENNILRLQQNDAFVIGSTASLPTTTPGTFINNSIIRVGSTAWQLVNCQEDDANYQLDVRNNFSSSVNAPTITNNGALIALGYNVFVGNLTQVVIATGAPVPGSAAINAGDPDAAYTDLDLSRNDAGCYGGSFTRDNFDDPMPTSAVVLFLNVPRRTTTGAFSIPITIDGIDR